MNKTGSGPLKRCFIFAAGTYYGLRAAPDRGPGAGGGCRVSGLPPGGGSPRICCWETLTPWISLPDFDHIRRVPVEKDDTDTMLAVKTGAGAGLRGVLHLRRHRRQAAGPHPGQSADTAVSAAMGPGDRSMTTILCGPPWRMRPSPCGADGGVGPALGLLPGAPASGIDEKGAVSPPTPPSRRSSPGRQQPHPRAQGPDHRPEGALLVGWELPWWRCFEIK